MNIVIVRDLKFGKLYKEFYSKFIGRLINKSLIVNTERFNQKPYYELEFITKPEERIFVTKEWNEKFLEIPENSKMPELNSLKDESIYEKRERIYYLVPSYKTFISNSTSLPISIKLRN